MIEQDVEVGPVTKVARDLTEIVSLSEALEDQAEHKANARIDGTGLPGGFAMVDLGNVGSPSEWAEQVAADELYHLSHCRKPNHSECHYAEQAAIEDEDTEPPLQTLLYWSEAWRDIHGYPLERRPTVITEANFIRYLLEWAWDNEPHFEDMAEDINKARLRLENVLYSGKRQERTRVVCPNGDCEPKPPRLIRLRGMSAGDDIYKCPRCKSRYTPKEFQDAHAKMLRSDDAAKFVKVPEAIATLVAQGRGKRTVRRWLEPPRQHAHDRCTVCRRKWPPQEYPVCPGKRKGQECGGELKAIWRGNAEAVVESYCDVKTHTVWVYWPDLWRRHLSTRRTPRNAAA